MSLLELAVVGFISRNEDSTKGKASRRREEEKKEWMDVPSPMLGLRKVALLFHNFVGLFFNKRNMFHLINFGKKLLTVFKSLHIFICL